MGVATLTTWHVQDSRSYWQAENIDYPGGFASITLQREKRAVLQQVV